MDEPARARRIPTYPRISRPRPARRAGPTPSPLFVAHFAMCAATAAALPRRRRPLPVPALRRRRRDAALPAGARSPRRRTTSSRAYEGTVPRGAPHARRLRGRVRRGPVGRAAPPLPAAARALHGGIRRAARQPSPRHPAGQPRRAPGADRASSAPRWTPSARA